MQALQSVALPGRPVPGSRGVPLAERDEQIRARIPELGAEVDTAAVTAAWEHALAAPAWDGPPVWLHGDLMPTNLLIGDGRLVGVIDWGASTTGDPAMGQPHPEALPSDPELKVWVRVDHAGILSTTATTNIWFGVGAPAGRFVLPDSMLAEDLSPSPTSEGDAGGRAVRPDAVSLDVPRAGGDPKTLTN